MYVRQVVFEDEPVVVHNEFAINMLAPLLPHGVVEKLECVQHFLHFALWVDLDVYALAPLLVVYTVALSKLRFICWDAD